MAKVLEEKLARVSAIDASTAVGRGELRKALADKAGLVVARAAKRIAKERVAELAGELPAVFTRLMRGGTAADKGCLAKQEVAQAIYELEVETGEAEEALLAGVRHVQEEPVLGGVVDTAAVLRGVCAMGLVRLGYRDVMTVLADLLGDPEQQTRIMAARAIGYAGQESGALLLRLKILSGDKDATVMAECFAALVQLTPAKALPLLERFLGRADDDLAQEAAMAIATSRREEAMAILKRHWDEDVLKRGSLLLPLAMLRRPEAVGVLLEVIGSGPEPLAAAAAEAMGMYRSDAAVSERVMVLARGRGQSVQRAAGKAMGR
jgi:hypothetical protein